MRVKWLYDFAPKFTYEMERPSSHVNLRSEWLWGLRKYALAEHWGALLVAIMRVKWLYDFAPEFTYEMERPSSHVNLRSEWLWGLRKYVLDALFVQIYVQSGPHFCT